MNEAEKDIKSGRAFKVNMTVQTDMRNMYGFVSYKSIINNIPMPSVISGQELPDGAHCMHLIDSKGRKLVMTVGGASEEDVVKAVNGEKSEGIVYGTFEDLSRYATSEDTSIYYYNTVTVCRMLGVECPNIVFADDARGGLTYNDRNGFITGIVVQKQEYADGMLREVFAELRHIWQQKNHPDWLEGYTFDPEGGEDFLMQQAEIDAQAFALAVCHKMFGWNYRVNMTKYENVNKLITQEAKKIKRNTPEIDKLPNLQE